MRKAKAKAVPICSACLTAACAAGILMCEDARRASILLRERAGGEAS